MEEQLIDIEKLIRQKNPSLLKWTPKFVLRYLKRILHQDEINQFISDHKHLKGVKWCTAVVKYLNLTYEVSGLENIPKEGKVTLVMNHPLGGVDAMILVDALKERRTDLKFIVNDILLNLEAMKEMFVGVNKVGKKKGISRDKLDELYASDKVVCIFPAGLVSRKINGEIKDLLWKKSFVSYSKKYERDIIPIYIDGGLSNFFYNLSKIRIFLGIKTNIEMLYLADELFKQRGKHIRFVIGEPIDSKVLEEIGSDVKIARKIKEKTYELKKKFIIDGKNH